MRRPLLYLLCLLLLIIESLSSKAQGRNYNSRESCEALGSRMEEAVTEGNTAMIGVLLDKSATSKSTMLQYRSIQKYHIMASKQREDSNYLASLEMQRRNELS